MTRSLIIVIVITIVSQTFGQDIIFTGKRGIFQPGKISTEMSEVKITFSPDGSRALWGTIGWENGKGGWDIWYAEKRDNEWTSPRNVFFNSDSNDFDPSFSPDGKSIWFFSNRSGGFGGDDIYYISSDSIFNGGIIYNAGPEINSGGDEWGPSFSPDGKYFFYCTDGKGGAGKHDIFIAEIKNSKPRMPELLAGINFEDDDFDPVFLHDNKTIIFTRKTPDKDEALLYITKMENKKCSPPLLLGKDINTPDSWSFGSAINPAEPGVFYFTSYIPGNNVGRVDIYRIDYEMTIND